MDIKLFTAVKAFIYHKGKILLLRESGKYIDGSNVGKYDVVGGRVNPGERFDIGLLREIQEETGLRVKVGQPFFVNEWRPVIRGEEWQIVGIFFLCSTDSNSVVLSDDHEEYIWIDPREYRQYPLIDNLMPVFENYLKYDICKE